ncbi:hypothetical protein LY90DRAFT_703350 [Neocallimastix californiae]|uniref:Uncharacterized protein n=1 Tax=Neocallimastix californiae TaxID=1754190 RepID=A0A1Y2CHX2_9FUNG|nr:hypothetical protein LY90DRAFT_703350 [Neocallimastix californiae]|eukprot:ORY46643.1 hypothetical protein LY90DRAFT_703350 [Neocallimastix californiae]
MTKITFEDIAKVILYIQEHYDEVSIRDIYPEGVPEDLYYFYLNDGPAKLKKKFGGIPLELKKKFPHGFPDEIKNIFKGKTPIEVIAQFQREGLPEPIKNIFPNGPPESLKNRYRNFFEEFKALSKPL